MSRSPFYEIWEGSDYSGANHMTPITIMAIVVLVALIVYCMCKRAQHHSCGACTSARASVAAPQTSANGPIEVRDKTHHDELVQDNVVMLYYAPWCGHCQQMKPYYKEAAKTHTDCIYAMIDCEGAVDASFMEQREIVGFPTVRFLSKGKVVSEYEGDRTTASLVAWAKEQRSK